MITLALHGSVRAPQVRLGRPRKSWQHRARTKARSIGVRVLQMWTRRGRGKDGSSAALSPGTPTLEEAFDDLVRRLGFDSQAPGWFEALNRLHRHSRARRLQVVPDFFYTSVFAPADLPASVWDGTFPDCGRWDRDAQLAFLRETPSFAAELSTLPYERPKAEEATFYWGNDQFSHSD